ncbi:MAG: WYL domain-containing protein [Gammaproteobacteria bacterium]|nr:WYL domain-containing protein [Gammaproteobacteria bacterium]
MADSSIRLLLILKHIPREPSFINSHQLLDILKDCGHAVSLRTIQRDLQSLSQYFPLIQTAPTGPGKEGLGWAFAKDSKNVSFPVLGGPAALAVVMAIEYLETLLPVNVLGYLKPYREEALQLLAEIDHGKLHSWTNKVRVAPQQLQLAPQIDSQSLQGIYLALLENKQIRATYKGKPDRIIHPYGLAQQGDSLYLICRFFEFDDIRVTALQRYSKVEVLDKEVRSFPDFKIDDYLNQGIMQWLPAEQKIIKMVLRVNQWLSQFLEERPLTEQQKIEPDGGESPFAVVEATLQDSTLLRRWLLSHSNDLEILQPAELRTWMAEIVGEQFKKYKAG